MEGCLQSRFAEATADPLSPTMPFTGPSSPSVASGCSWTNSDTWRSPTGVVYIADCIDFLPRSQPSYLVDKYVRDDLRIPSINHSCTPSPVRIYIFMTGTWESQ